MEQPLLLITTPTYSPNYSTQPTITSYHITTIEPKTHIRSDSKSHEPSSRAEQRSSTSLQDDLAQSLLCDVITDGANVQTAKT